METNLYQDIISDGNLVITKIKVDGGHVVNSYDKSHNILGSCFVPDLRTQLAAMALQGVISDRGPMYSSLDDVNRAVRAADALIAKLNKGKDNE